MIITEDDSNLAQFFFSRKWKVSCNSRTSCEETEHQVKNVDANLVLQLEKKRKEKIDSIVLKQYTTILRCKIRVSKILLNVELLSSATHTHL